MSSREFLKSKEKTDVPKILTKEEKDLIKVQEKIDAFPVQVHPCVRYVTYRMYQFIIENVHRKDYTTYRLIKVEII